MKTFKIIGIDPGNNTGVSIFTIDSKKYTILDIETDIKVLDNFTTEKDNSLRLFKKAKFLKGYVNRLVNEYNPTTMAIETAFLNNRFPKAVMQLSVFTSYIELGIYESNPYLRLFKYPPKYIKRYVGAGGNADKDKMLSNLKSIKEITKHIIPDKITEHEVDATSIAYVLLKEIREDSSILYRL